MSKAYVLKNENKATVYSVGLYDSDPENNTVSFMNYTSSNYPFAESMTYPGSKFDDKYYMTASDADELNEIFTYIIDDSTESSTTVTLDAKSVLRDILNDGFVLPAGYDAQENITVATQSVELGAEGNIVWGEVEGEPQRYCCDGR